MGAFRKLAIVPQNIPTENDLPVLPNYSYHMLFKNEAYFGIQ
jgi:hypothetical protein